ncbi:MAG: radical SAM protein, partial [Calditrichaeota bacterium]
NCVYCQYGWTEGNQGKQLWPEVHTVQDAVESVLKQLPVKPDYLTFSGNGEPTLHPRFPEIVDILIRLRDVYAPDSRTAILSNSSTLALASIRQAIMKLDARIMKLDCGEEACFKRFNRPARGITLKKIFNGLQQLAGVTIQALFAEGEEGNYESSNISAWIDKLKTLKPRDTQIYTLDRGYPSGNIYPVSPKKLLILQDRLRNEGVNARAYG